MRVVQGPGFGGQAVLLLALRIEVGLLAYALDTGWMEDAFLKRKALYSPVVCFETSDPKRMEQLKSYLMKHPETEGAENVFLYEYALYRGVKNFFT